MYYVKKGSDSYFVARGPKFQEGACVGSIPDLGLLYYDYDDLDHWDDKYLAEEARIVSDEDNEGYDPAAMVAVHGEMNRRAGKDAPPWFDYFDDLVADLNLAVKKEDENNNWDEDWNDRKPIITIDEIDPPTHKLIKDLARIEKKRWEKKSLSVEEVGKLQSALMNSRFADRICDGIDPVEDQKIVAAHLLFLYAQERQSAEQEGRKPDEDYLLAGSSLYNVAAIEQMLDEDEEDDDDYIFPQDMDMAALGRVAESFSETMKKADVDDLKDMEESTEWFLKEKGFDISTLSGCKAAQAWLEKAQPADAFITEGPIENEVDWHVGEARLESMLKIVKARIEKKS